MFETFAPGRAFKPTMPQLRAFAICPTCSELYPSFRGCPACDGDVEPLPAPVVTAAPEPQPVPIERVEYDATAPRARAQGPNLVPYVAALSVGVIVACGVLMALITG